MAHRLFVYGTLAPGRPNAHVLAAIEGEWEEATVHGTLLQEGWGAALGYPALHLGDDGHEVNGFLFTSQHLEMLWGRLDEFEGEEYERCQVTATRLCGEQVEAQVYVHKQT